MRRKIVITEELMDHLAWLARIKLTENEKREFLRDLNRVLEFFNEIDKVDVEGIEPTTHTALLTNVLRDDVPHKPLPQAEVLYNAPEKENGYFKAPKIL